VVVETATTAELHQQSPTLAAYFLDSSDFVTVRVRNVRRGRLHSCWPRASGREVKVGGEHLHLFAEHNARGVQASVYNVNAKNWIAPSETVHDIQQGDDPGDGRCGSLSQTRCQHRIASFAMEEVSLDIE
jgi:hypothetical protein